MSIWMIWIDYKYKYGKNIMIVISNPINIEHEIEIIHNLFNEGITLFHIRKPNFSMNETLSFIQKIDPKYHHQLVLHHHHSLVSKFNINRIHYTEKERNNNVKTIQSMAGYILSTSVHTINDFNSLSLKFDYAFLGPIFNSLSKKEYYAIPHCKTAIAQRTQFKTKLIGLGGITMQNTKIALQYGCDNVAFLGHIWQHTNPVEIVKQWKKLDLMP